MGTVALRGSAAPLAPIPQGAPRKTLLSIGNNALEIILSLLDDVRASRTCRDFRKATDALIQREWQHLCYQLETSFCYWGSIFRKEIYES
jgi:hypothetical protein